MAFDETTLDSDFASFLSADLASGSGSTSRTPNIEVGDEPEEDQEISPNPITDTQKRKLFQLLSNLNHVGFDSHTLERLLKINNLNEQEAKHLIDYAEVLKDTQFSKEVTSRIMEGITFYTLNHPDEVVQKLTADETLVNELNYFFGSVLAFLGKLKGPFMFGTYLMFTHLKEIRTGRGKYAKSEDSNGQPQQARNYDASSFSTLGVR